MNSYVFSLNSLSVRVPYSLSNRVPVAQLRIWWPVVLWLVVPWFVVLASRISGTPLGEQNEGQLRTFSTPTSQGNHLQRHPSGKAK